MFMFFSHHRAAGLHLVAAVATVVTKQGLLFSGFGMSCLCLELGGEASSASRSRGLRTTARKSARMAAGSSSCSGAWQSHPCPGRGSLFSGQTECDAPAAGRSEEV